MARAPSSVVSTVGSTVPPGASIVGEVPALHARNRIAPRRAAKPRSVRRLASCLPWSTSCRSVRSRRTATSFAPNGALPRRSSSTRAATRRSIRLALAAHGSRCAAILVTHGHFDHILGLAELAEGTGAPVYGPAGERALLETPDAFTPPGIHVRPWTADVLLEGGESLELAGLHVDVVAVPGHSPGHLAYAVDGVLFSGDVLFAGSVGRTDLPGGDWDDAARLDPHARRALPAGDGRPSRATGPRRRSARSSRATRSSPSSAMRSGGSGVSGEDRAAARDPRRRPGRDAALAARHEGDRAALRALRLPADRDAGASRTPRSSRARPAQARTSCRRRCTPSPTAATARSRSGRRAPRRSAAPTSSTACTASRSR